MDENLVSNPWRVNALLIVNTTQSIRLWSPRQMRVVELKYSKIIADVVDHFRPLRVFGSEALAAYIKKNNLDFDVDEFIEELYQKGIFISPTDFDKYYKKLNIDPANRIIPHLVLYKYVVEFYQAAKNLGYSVEYIHPALIEVRSKNRKHWILSQFVCSLIKKDDLERVMDKDKCSYFLISQGFGAPKGKVFKKIDDAMILDLDFSYPVVLKPVNGRNSRAVVCDITSSQELKKIIAQIKLEKDNTDSEFRIEECIQGDTLRFFYACGQIKATTQIGFAKVVGDGSATIEELIDRKKIYTGTSGKNIHISIHKTIASLNLSLSSVLPEGKDVILSRTAGPVFGGDKTNLDDVIPGHIKNKTISMMKALGLSMGCAEAVVPKHPDGAYDYEKMKFVDINPASDFLMHAKIRPELKSTIFSEIITWIMESEEAEPIFPVEVPIYPESDSI